MRLLLATAAVATAAAFVTPDFSGVACRLLESPHVPEATRRYLQQQGGGGSNQGTSGGGGGRDIPSGCTANQTQETTSTTHCCAAQAALGQAIQSCGDPRFGAIMGYYVTNQNTLNRTTGPPMLAAMCTGGGADATLNTCWTSFRDGLMAQLMTRPTSAPGCAEIKSNIPPLQQLCARDSATGPFCPAVFNTVTQDDRFLYLSFPGQAANVTQEEVGNICGECVGRYINAYATSVQLRNSPENQFIVRQLSATRNMACARDPTDNQLCTVKLAAHRATALFRDAVMDDMAGFAAGDVNVFTAPEFACSHCGRLFQSGYYETINRGLDYAVASAQQNAARSPNDLNATMGVMMMQAASAALEPVVTFMRGVSDAACGSFQGRRCSRYWVDMMQQFSALAATPMPRPGASTGGLVPPMTGSRPNSGSGNNQQQQQQAQGSASARPTVVNSALPSFSAQPSGIPARPATAGAAALGIFSCLNSDFLTTWNQRNAPPTCSANCRAGLTALRATMGCCAVSFLEFQARLSSLTPGSMLPNGMVNVSLPGGVSLPLPVNGDDMFTSMRGACNIDIRRCGTAQPPPRLTTRLANMRFAWLASNLTRLNEFKARFIRDLARTSGQSPSVFNITDIRDGSVIVTTEVITSDETTAQQIATSTQSSVSASSFTDVQALTAEDPSGALINPSASFDVTAQIATATPAPSGAAGTTVAFLVTLAVALATVIAAASRWSL